MPPAIVAGGIPIVASAWGLSLVSAIQRQFWFDSVRARQSLSPMDRLVAMTVGFAVHVGSTAWAMTYDEIGGQTGCSKDTATRAVKRLEEAGWLNVRRTGGRRANTFMLTLPSPLRFPDEETSRLTDVDETKAANLRQSNADKIVKRGKFTSFPSGKNSSSGIVEQPHNSAAVEGGHDSENSRIALRPLEVREQPQSYAADADVQQPQMGVPTAAELCGPIKIKETITYNPFDAQPATEDASCNPSSASGKRSPLPTDQENQLSKKLYEAQILQPAKAPTLVFVECDTKPGRAWEAFWLRTKRVRPNWYTAPDQGYRRGWYFPTEFPPDDAA